MEILAGLIFLAGLIVLAIGGIILAFQAIQEYLEERKH